MTWQFGAHPDDAARAAAAAARTAADGAPAWAPPRRPGAPAPAPLLGPDGLPPARPLTGALGDPLAGQPAEPADPTFGIPSRPQVRRPALVLRPRADTRDAVILELLPLLAPVLAIVATQAMLPWSVPLLLVCIAVTCGAQFVIASRDAALLRSRGFVGTAPSVLALVSPILYLVLRGRVCSQHDRTAYAPVPWAVGSTVVAVLLLIGTAWFESSVDGSLGGMLTGLF